MTLLELPGRTTSSQKSLPILCLASSPQVLESLTQTCVSHGQSTGS